MNNFLIEEIQENSENNAQGMPDFPITNFPDEKLAKWDTTSLLNKLSKENKRKLAILLENTRLMNEEDTNLDDRWRRISIPLIVRIFKNWHLSKLVDVQPIYGNYPDIKRRKFKAIYNRTNYGPGNLGLNSFNLDAEAELTAVLAQAIELEISREIIGELCKNAGISAQWDFNMALGNTIKEKYESLYVKLVELENTILKKTGHTEKSFFVITSPEIASVFETATAGFSPLSSKEFLDTLGIQYCGTLNMKWRLFKDPLFVANNVLIGYRDEKNAGYRYMPQLLVTGAEKTANDLGLRQELTTWYAGKMLNPNYYATLEIKNFII